MYSALPAETHPDRSTLGGACINCWINTNSMAEAQRRATDLIADAGWTVTGLEETQAVDLERFAYSKTAFERIEQAKIDGECIVIFQHPLDDADST